MQDARALRNSANLNSWRAWEEEAHRRSGFTGILGAVFALTLAFVFVVCLFGRALGERLLPLSLVGLIFVLGATFVLLAFAVLRTNAWKRAHPWTPPS